MKISITKDLSALRTAAKRRIDTAAEAARISPARLTGGDGQQQEYAETLHEARTYQAATSPVDADYPMLIAERNAQINSGSNPSATVASVATAVISEFDAWNAVGVQIKEERRTGKLLVDQALIPADIEREANAAIAAIEAI